LGVSIATISDRGRGHNHPHGCEVFESGADGLEQNDLIRRPSSWHLAPTQSVQVTADIGLADHPCPQMIRRGGYGQES
jgi:hypothetical protein